MNKEIVNKLKKEYQSIDFSINDIPDLTNKDYLKGDNKTKKYYNDKRINLTEIEDLIPQIVKEKTTDILWGGKFYCITFRK